jgi:hemoglobin
MLPASTLDETTIKPLVEAFYAKVRADALLAPVFNSAIADWDDHHARLVDFWSSIMLASGRYKGSPLALHLLHADAMTPERFARWLELWRQCSSATLEPAAAASVQAKATRIADSFQLALHYRHPSPAAA